MNFLLSEIKMAEKQTSMKRAPLTAKQQELWNKAKEANDALWAYVGSDWNRKWRDPTVRKLQVEYDEAYQAFVKCYEAGE